MSFVRIRDYTSDPAWEAVDSHSGDIEKAVSACTDPAYSMTPGLRWSEDFEEAIEMPAGDLLIVGRVHITPESGEASASAHLPRPRQSGA